MTNLHGLTAQKTELEAIQENIRLGKTIFGVWPGTYSGGAASYTTWPYSFISTCVPIYSSICPADWRWYVNGTIW